MSPYRIIAAGEEPDVTRTASYTSIMQALVRHLQAVDTEAVPLEDGCPTGLWWYARHCSREAVAQPRSYRNEEKWSRRLECLLMEEGIDASTEVRYPTPPRRRCDLVIQWPSAGRLWLEVKGAWKHRDRYGKLPNNPYGKHLHAAGKDLVKLTTLGQNVADHLGMLVIGFDTSIDPISEADVKRVRSGCKLDSWVEQYADWSDRYRPDGKVRVWLWLRPVAKQ